MPPNTDSGSDHVATLTIGVPTLTYVGQTGQNISAEATITAENGIKGSATVKYYNANEDGTAKTGDLLSSAPIDAGKYWAEITLTNADNSSSATAHVVYSIAKAIPAAPANAEAAGFTVNYFEETFTVGTAYEVSTTQSDAGLISDGSLTSAIDSTDHKVYIRAKETNDTQAGAWLAVTLNTRSPAPATLSTTNATNSSTADGKINGTGNYMEYKNKAENGEPAVWTTATQTATLVKPGTYLVRIAATNNSFHGVETEVTVGSKEIILLDGQKPTAKTGLIYTGSEQELINAPAAALPAGATEMRYAIGTDATTVPTDGWSTDIPTATEVGTYYVWYKVVGDANHNDTTPVYVEVTISNRPTPSGGGTTPATITIPVSGEGKDAEKVEVTVQVTGATATVTSADVDKVLEAKDVGTVTVDVSGLNNSVDEVVLPAEMVKKVADAVADKGNDASGLEVKLPSGTVTFDAKTVAALKDQSNGKDLKLHLNKVSETTLTSAQQSAVKDLNKLVVLDAYVTADGKRISDFNGGTATFSVPVILADGQNAAGVTAYFVAENGEKTEIPCTYDGKNATGTVTHFSNYVVAYDTEKAKKAEESAKQIEDTVKDLDALPAAADVKLTDKEAIEKARAAYDALTDEQKAKVPADTLKRKRVRNTSI